MPVISNLYSLVEDSSKEFISNFLEADDVYVYSKLRATKLIAKKTEDGWKFYKNKKIPLTKIDRMLMGGFEFLIQYLETLDVDIIRQLPINTFYYFEFSPHTKKVYLLYMESNTQKYTLSEIQKYSKILEVNPPNIIHSGPLSDEAKKDILDIIHLGQEISTENFLQKVFGHSTSISSDVEIDNIIINFENNKTKQSYTARLASSILNGYIRFVEKNKNNITKPPINDVYAILFLDSLAFMTNAVKNFKPEEYIVNYDERYIDYICKAFNAFYDLNYRRYTDIDLYEPEFMKTDLFQLNKEFIKNPYTLKLINKSVQIEKLFKVFCAIFNKKKNINSVLNPLLNKFHIQSQNIIIDKIIDIVSVNEKLENTVIDLEVLENLSNQNNPKWKGFDTVDEYELYESVDNLNSNKTIYTYSDIKNILTEDVFPDKENVPFKKSLKLKSNPGGIISFWDNVFDTNTKKDYGKKGMKNVNIILGTYQPFHNGHRSLIHKMYDINKLSTLIVVLPLKKKNLYSLSKNVIKEILSEVKVNEEILVEDYYYAQSRDFNDIIDELYLNNYKVNYCCSTDDRINDWILRSMNNDKNLSKINLVKDDTNIFLDDGTELTSKCVRNCVTDNNYTKYKKCVPDYLHSYFYKIKKCNLKFKNY